MNFKLCALSLLLATAALPALAIGRLADITVVDRATGATLPVHSHRGEYWVAGTPGARYSISVRSKMGQRLMAVPAVDGINVLSGQTAAWHQSGYVFSSYGQYQITGWRKTDSEVAAFEFAALGDSYAALTGRPANVGVIGVALFREKQQSQPQWRPHPPQRPYHPDELSSRELGSREMSDATASAKSQSAPATPPASPANRRESIRSDSNGAADAEASASQRSTPQPTAKLGTAHGQRETSVVNSTTFERQSAQPDEVISIRYDSRANLLALGVIHAPHQQHVPSAFPESPSAYAPNFVPDPPHRRY